MGVLVNFILIVVPGAIGLLIHSGIPVNLNERLMEAIGIAVFGIAIAGIIQNENQLVMILSLVIGTFIGEMIDIDKHIRQGVNVVSRKFVRSGGEGADKFSTGFVSATMIFCIGSLAILGPLESGLTGSNTTLYLKSIFDSVTSVLLASSLGVGVVFAAIPVVVIESAIILLSRVVAPYLPPVVITEIVAVGSILLFGMGLNLLNITKLKVMNFTPAMIMPVILVPLLG